MSEIDLTKDELGAVLGDDVLGDGAVSAEKQGDGLATGAPDVSSDNISIMKKYIDQATAPMQIALSQLLGEEVYLSCEKIEETKGISAEGEGDWYVADGEFTNNGPAKHVFLFPSGLSQSIVSQYSSIDDIGDQEEQIVGPLSELGQKLIDELAKSFGNTFVGKNGDFRQSNNVSGMFADEMFLRIEWSIGGTSFFEFFSNVLIGMLRNTMNAASTSTNITEKSPDVGFADMGDGDQNMFSLGDDESSSSLGEALLDQSISDVEAPDFNTQTDTVSSQAIRGDGHSINMLKDVTMTVTVELGSTRKSIGEILELNRGSIVELKKLAGEPLDIKINQKLIAKGEVIVIDEYFGVRIIEVISADERLNSKSSTT